MEKNKIVYKADLTGVSFVEYPATMQSALFFEAIRYEITSVVMYPNTPIDRGDFNIVFDKECISTLQKQLLNGEQKLTLHHDDDSSVMGKLQLCEVFVLTPDKHNGVYSQYPLGTLMATYHCFDKDLYNTLKENGFGISIEIDNIECYTKLNKNKKMEIKRFCSDFAFAEHYELDGEGTPILIVDAEGKAFLSTMNGEDEIIDVAPDSDYTTLEGEIITVTSGKVTKEEEAEQEIVDETEMEKKINSYRVFFCKTKK